MPKITALLLLLAAAVGGFPQCLAQSLPIGTISVNDFVISCSSARNGSLFYPGMYCRSATISCPGAADIQLTFGWTGPSSPKGTVVFFSGGSGMTPTENGDDIPTYAASYASTFEIVQVEWASPWEDPSSDGSGGNVLTGACRPATFLNYINNSTLHQQGAMCAQGSSAGGAATGFPMAWYGAASYLKECGIHLRPDTQRNRQGLHLAKRLHPYPLRIRNYLLQPKNGSLERQGHLRPSLQLLSL
jgi:hypothetical protein